MTFFLTLTWPVKSIAGTVVVVAFVKGQPDVSRALGGLLEDQARHVAPQLEGGLHRQTHRAPGQVLRPVHHLVGQMSLGPLLT